MADPDSRLDALLEAMRAQLALLEDARVRPDVEQATVKENALFFLLQAFRSAADPELAQKIDAYLSGGAQAHTHLLELAAGWRCVACKQRVPAAAALSGVRAGQPKLSIVCKACGAASPATTDGTRALLRSFSVSAEWDPLANGFAWDGT
jgi:hypothetical protein